MKPAPAFEGRLLHLDGDKEQFNGKAVEEVLIVKVVAEGMGKHLEDDDIVQLRALGQGMNEMLWFAAAGTDKDATAVFNGGNRLLPPLHQFSFFPLFLAIS